MIKQHQHLHTNIEAGQVHQPIQSVYMIGHVCKLHFGIGIRSVDSHEQRRHHPTVDFALAQKLESEKYVLAKKDSYLFNAAFKERQVHVDELFGDVRSLVTQVELTQKAQAIVLSFAADVGSE